MPATASRGDQNALSGRCKVVTHLVGFRVVDNRSHRHRDFQIVAVLSVPVAALAVLAAVCAKRVVVSKFEEGIFLGVGDQIDVAAVSTVSAARTAPRNEFFTSKRDTPVSTVTGTHGNLRFVNEHTGKKSAADYADSTDLIRAICAIRG